MTPEFGVHCEFHVGGFLVSYLGIIEGYMYTLESNSAATKGYRCPVLASGPFVL